MSGPIDKTGREIMVGDVLKVFHFVGRYRKNHFMYKHVIGETTLGKPKPGTEQMIYLQVSHLNLTPFDERDGGYWLPKDGTPLAHYEIVQGRGLDDRPKRSAT